VTHYLTGHTMLASWSQNSK